MDVNPETTRALLAAPVAFNDAPDASTVGELLAGILLDEWQTAPRFTPGKAEVYLAAVRAGLISGVAAGDRIAAAEALTEAAIRAMGQPGMNAGEVRKLAEAAIAERFEDVVRAQTDRVMHEKLAEVEATVRASERERVTSSVRAMISAKRTAIADAGISHGLAPDFHEATFTATEILAVLGDQPAGAADPS